MTRPEAIAFDKATDWLRRFKRPLLVSHRNPDGDALGSLAAMRLLLGHSNISATPVLFDDISSRYTMFNRYEPMPIWNAASAAEDWADIDSVILLDTCAKTQVEPIIDWLAAAALPTMAVDHHTTRDDLAEIYVVDESAAANCLILYEWAKAAGWTIDRATAEALLIGIAMDTGWFRFANTDARAFSAAADLVVAGARPAETCDQLFQREKPGRVRLLGEALGTLRLLHSDRLAIMTLSQGSFERAGAAYDDTEDIVNEPLRIETTLVSVLLVDRGDGQVRASFRSKEPFETGTPDVDVAIMAAEFGGGGHRRAAGARIEGRLSDVTKAIADLTARAFA